MDDTPGFEIPASPGINSVLKVPKPRIPLKELLPAAPEEDNTAARKRRVSFANVNKIKEFSAGAESMVVCHTPAYEEPFSLSSDSSCPSGVDGGWTPAKCPENPIEAASLTIKENVLGQDVFVPDFHGYGQIDNLRTPLFGPASCSVGSDGMDLTSCVGRASSRGSARFSVGMELTEVIRSSVNNSGEYMDLTKGAAARQSYQPYLYTTDMNDSDRMLADDSDALELTDAIADPRLIAASTRYSTTNMDSTKNIYAVNHTRYSVSGMDLTKAAMSVSPSTGRRSSRYSLSNMELTEVIDHDYSGLEFTEVISEPKIVHTRYSVNDMDLTEAISRGDLTRMSLTTMDCTSAVRNKLEGSVNSDSSMDFTKPIYNTHEATSNRDSMTTMGQVQHRQSSLCSATMDSLELNESSNDSEDTPTPTTQTYNGIEPLSASKGVNTAEKLTEHEELNKSQNKREEEINGSSLIEINKLGKCSLPSDNVVQNKFIEQKLTLKSSKVNSGLEDPINNISDATRAFNSNGNDSVQMNHVFPNMCVNLSSRATNVPKLYMMDKVHTEKDVDNFLNNPECEDNECSNTDRSEISPTKENTESNFCIASSESKIILKPDEAHKEKQTTLISDKAMDLCKSPVSKTAEGSPNSNQPIDNIKNTLKDTILGMDISGLTPEKITTKINITEDIKDNGLKDEISEMDISVLTPEKLTTKYDVIDSMKCIGPRDEIFQMDIALTPEKKTSVGKNLFSCKTFQENKSSLDQMAVLNDGRDEISLVTGENRQHEVLTDVSMEVSFSESDPVKKSEEHIGESEQESCDPKHHSDVENAKEKEVGTEINEDGIAKTKDVSTEISENEIAKEKEVGIEINEKVNKSQQNICNDLSKNQTNESITNRLDNSKSYREEIENNLSQVESSLNNLTIPTDVTINTSIANKPCFSNITMTRGAASRYSSDSHDLTVEASSADVTNNIVDQPSELDTSLPQSQNREFSPKALQVLDISENVSKDADILCRREKGGKRSFEVALEPENDTEESPVKQICLPSSIHLQDSDYLNSTLPSISMDKMTTHYESVPGLLHSTVNTSTHCSLIDLNRRRKSCSENDQLKMKTTIVMEQSVVDEGHGNDFSLRVDLTHHHNVSNTETDFNRIETSYQRNEPREKLSFCFEKNEDIVNITNDQLPNSVHLSVTNKLPISKNVPFESSAFRQGIQPTLDQSFQTNLFSKEKTACKATDNHLAMSVSNPSANKRAITLKTPDTFRFRKQNPLRELREGVFACDLIPKWIELCFSIGPDDTISKPVFKLVCSEKDMVIGEYLLQQVKSAALPADVQSLTAEIKEPQNTTHTHLAKNLSLICKYYGGTLKGNTLTLELVSCKHKFWTFVDVNIKYPKYVSAEDIVISEQRIGELKLSMVRNIFGSIASGPNQLLHFASALTHLQYG